MIKHNILWQVIPKGMDKTPKLPPLSIDLAIMPPIRDRIKLAKKVPTYIPLVFLFLFFYILSSSLLPYLFLSYSFSSCYCSFFFCYWCQSPSSSPPIFFIFVLVLFLALDVVVAVYPFLLFTSFQSINRSIALTYVPLHPFRSSLNPSWCRNVRKNKVGWDRQRKKLTFNW